MDIERLSKKSLKYLFTTRILEIDTFEDGVYVTASLLLSEKKEVKIDHIKLKLRNESKDLEYLISVKTTKRLNRYLLEFFVDFSKYEFESFYWDVFIGVYLDGQLYYIQLKNPSLNVYKEINNKVLNCEYIFEDGFMIYPYITKGSALAFNYRKREYYEDIEYKIKENLAYLVYVLFKPYFYFKNIWLAYEKFSETAQDNGYYFFNYCYRNKKHKNFYYIIKEDSGDIKNLRGMEDKVIRFMSFKHMVYLYAAKLLVASESKGHCYDIRIQKGKLKRALDKKKIVFLQHGVISFKKVEFFKKSKNKMDLFVVSSDYEKEIIKKYFEYNDREIINTGLCRWDVLEDKVDINNRQILIMPTWRSWMDGVSDQQFINSDYYKNYFELLNSKELYKIIREKNIKLNFFIHPKFKEYIGNFSVENENINIYQFGEIELNKLLMETSLLITDYSSVAWDMYYQKKPVIFYQFDIDDYDMYQGSYIDMETELYGDRVIKTEELINVVKEYIAREFKEKDQYAKMRSIYLSHVDKNNCERTYNAIMERKDMLRMKKYDFFLLLKNNYYVRSMYSRLKRNKFLHTKMRKIIRRLKK